MNRSAVPVRSSEPYEPYGQACTDLNSLCYNSVSGQGQLLWVGLACTTVLDGGLAWCPWCPLTSEFGSMGLKWGDAGETIEPEESQ